MGTSMSRMLGLASVIVVVAAIAGCGSTSSSSTTSTTAAAKQSASKPAATSGDPAVEALVPAVVKSAGILIVASDASDAPDEFVGPGGTVVGWDPDLVNAIASVMGVKARIINAPFDSIIPGMISGRYEIGASSFEDTKLREKVVDFVDYIEGGESFFTKSTGGESISDIGGLCGLSVSVESGSTEESDAQTQSEKCTKAGKPAVKVLVYPTQAAANLALSSGRAQIAFADSPVAAYQVKRSNGAFKLVGQTYASAPWGLAIRKNSGLTKPISAALKVLMADGKYMSILTKWGIQGDALSAPKINGATS